jgi:hypothetical protein
MVSVPLRGVVDVLAVALNPIVPGPLPFAPDVTLNHPVLLLVAVHVQPVGAVMPTVPVPPVPTTDPDGAPSVKVHGTPASCTLSVLPAIVTEPLRTVAVALAVALMVTDPGPVPDAPAVTLTQEELVAAVQPQPAGDVTVMTAGPPLDVSETDVGAIVELHVSPD